MSFEILFIEDNQHKRQRIAEYVGTLSPEIRMVEAHSFSSGCQAIEAKDYKLIFLDISLPTYDRNGTESGGRFRPFAGMEIARKLARENSNSKILFITQYVSFSDRGTSYSFESLKEALAKEAGTHYAGMVLYDSSQYAWKEAIAKIIEQISA